MTGTWNKDVFVISTKELLHKKRLVLLFLCCEIQTYSSLYADYRAGRQSISLIRFVPEMGR